MSGDYILAIDQGTTVRMVSAWADTSASVAQAVAPSSAANTVARGRSVS